MAVPKSKISNSRRGMRRSHLRLKGKNFIEDKNRFRLKQNIITCKSKK